VEVSGDRRLAQLEYLGDATPFAARLHAMLPYWPLFENLNLEEIGLMSHFLQVYRAQAGQEVIREGDTGDFMMFIIEGRIQVCKQGVNDRVRPLAVVGAGRTLGEMSLIDGDPRSATCIADAPTVMGVLTRASLANIIIEQPILGAKILMELVVMLSHRLRETSSQLLACLDRERGQPGHDALADGFV
jgi:CRP/FNR family cyclic AMP-dependent transcriptional regulator